MRLRDRLLDGLASNPLPWLLFAAFLVAEWGNYKHEKQLDRVCELSGEHDLVVAHPRTDREKLDNICADREPEQPEN